MNVYKDDSVWAGSGKTYIVKDGSISYTNLTAIPDGTYEINEGATDTGVSVTVSGASARYLIFN